MLETSQIKDTHSVWTEIAIDLTKERGVYNLYVQVAGGGNVGQAVDVSPNEMEVDESGHHASDGLRQVNP